MRELELDEIDLVSGGYRAGTDGPSVDYSFGGLLGATATGAGVGGGLTAALGVHLGYAGQVLSNGVLRGTGAGAVIGGAWYGGTWLGASINAYNERESGMSFGEALYRTLN